MYVSMYAFVRMFSCVYICVCARVIESFCANHYLVSELPVAASHRMLLHGGSGVKTMSVEGPPAAGEGRDGGVARPERERDGGSTTTAATFQVTIPEPFTFSRPEEWVKWIRRFESRRV